MWGWGLLVRLCGMLRATNHAATGSRVRKLQPVMMKPCEATRLLRRCIQEDRHIQAIPSVKTALGLRPPHTSGVYPGRRLGMEWGDFIVYFLYSLKILCITFYLKNRFRIRGGAQWLES